MKAECGMPAFFAHVALGVALAFLGLFWLALSGPISDRRKYGGPPGSRKWGAW